MTSWGEGCPNHPSGQGPLPPALFLPPTLIPPISSSWDSRDVSSCKISSRLVPQRSRRQHGADTDACLAADSLSAPQTLVRVCLDL